MSGTASCERLKKRGHTGISRKTPSTAPPRKPNLTTRGRIGKLEELVALADVVDPSSLSGNKVVFGATVSIEETDSGELQTFARVRHRRSPR
jgi:transcription elongation factor GreA